MMLLAASGFFVKSLLNVSRVDLGIKVDNVITFGLSPELSGYTPEQSRAVLRAARGGAARRRRASRRVTVSLVPLLAGSNWGSDVNVQGFQSGPDTDSNSRFNEVGPGYFRRWGSR
mgnify:CR=1 FL=1